MSSCSLSIYFRESVVDTAMPKGRGAIESGVLKREGVGGLRRFGERCGCCDLDKDVDGRYDMRGGFW